MMRQHLPTLRVYFAKPERGHSGPFKTEIKAADTGA
jgi:hypothetical protein